MGDAFTERLLAIEYGYNRPTYALWPAATGVPAASVVMTPGAGAWGAYIDIIAAAAITTEFWLMSVHFALSAGVHAVREVQIYNATTTTALFDIRVDCTAANVNIAPFPFPIPAWIDPNDQIQGRMGAINAADKISVALLVATGL